MIKNAFAFIKKIFVSRQATTAKAPPREDIGKSRQEGNGQVPQDPSAHELKRHLRHLLNLSNALDLAEIEQEESGRRA
jgi:hypothetical protein